MSDEQKMEELIKYYEKKAIIERSKYTKKDAPKRRASAYEYDDQGNLVERKNGEVIRTIPLSTYRDLTLNERIEMEQARKDAIELAMKKFDDARMALHHEYQKEDRSEYEILRLNQEAEVADLNLQQAQFPARSTIMDKSVMIRQLDFSQPNEVRKYPYQVAISQSSPFTLQDQYVRIGEPGVRKFVSIAEAKKAIAGTVIVFDNVNPGTEGYGFLSLNWPVEIEVEGTMYHSARQAIFGELAKSFDDEEHYQEIMTAEQPDHIHYTVQDVPGFANNNNNGKETAQEQWDATLRDLIDTVNYSKFEQYPALGGQLLETQDATLGAYEPDDNLFGTGVPLTHQRAKNPIYWTGKNLQGKALMRIRSILRKKREEEEAKMAAPKKSVKKTASLPSVPPVMPSAKASAPVMPSMDPSAPVMPLAEASAPVMPSVNAMSNTQPIAPVALEPPAAIAPNASVAPIASVAPNAPIAPIAPASRPRRSKPVVMEE